jgi:hypothetical protein
VKGCARLAAWLTDVGAIAGRAICFMIGGVTYSEMRCAYKTMQAAGREVIIGGTHYLTATSLIRQLREVR